MNRETSVAGLFYSDSRVILKKQIQNFFNSVKFSNDSNGIIVPHAGYVYSGQIAAHAFGALKKEKTYVILCPNHTGLGSSVSVYPKGKWNTPFGGVSVDSKISGKIIENVTETEFDELAHISEHSIEVQLPFLQHLFNEDFKIVPIAIGLDSKILCEKLGSFLSDLSKENSIGLIASSDFSHYVPLNYAKKMDLEAISYIEKLDSSKFYNFVNKNNLSICGHLGIKILLDWAIFSQKKAGKLIKYGTSASETKDSSSVVGYAAIKIV